MFTIYTTFGWVDSLSKNKILMIILHTIWRLLLIVIVVESKIVALYYHSKVLVLSYLTNISFRLLSKLRLFLPSLANHIKFLNYHSYKRGFLAIKSDKHNINAIEIVWDYNTNMVHTALLLQIVSAALALSLIGYTSADAEGCNLVGKSWNHLGRVAWHTAGWASHEWHVFVIIYTDRLTGNANLLELQLQRIRLLTQSASNNKERIYCLISTFFPIQITLHEF